MNRSPCGRLQEHQRTVEPSTTSSSCALGDCLLCQAAMRADFRDIPDNVRPHELPKTGKQNKNGQREQS